MTPDELLADRDRWKARALQAERHLPATLDWFRSIGGRVRGDGFYHELGKIWHGGQFVWYAGKVLRTRGEVIDAARGLGIKIEE
jgi:hypothetical protein